ncbi:fumarylacetoacetate hydrolase family protein [Micromonospora sp. NPDC047707]|uniref:fumarylacetoacetate hydrolase family protein n=1 Tax=Micromonospora sp. NPDC047707 TaxID=3154498 RepID=UPI0034561D51
MRAGIWSASWTGRSSSVRTPQTSVFGPAALVSYISQILTLAPGDIIATGTPGGVGHARHPRRYLGARSVVVTRITGIGECRNTCVSPAPINSKGVNIQ